MTPSATVPESATGPGRAPGAASQLCRPGRGCSPVPCGLAGWGGGSGGPGVRAQFSSPDTTRLGRAPRLPRAGRPAEAPPRPGPLVPGEDLETHGRSSGDRPGPSGPKARTDSGPSSVSGGGERGPSPPGTDQCQPPGPCQAPASRAAQGRHQLPETSSPQWPPCRGPPGGPKARRPWLGGDSREEAPTGHPPLRGGWARFRGRDSPRHTSVQLHGCDGCGLRPPRGTLSLHTGLWATAGPPARVGGTGHPDRRWAGRAPGTTPRPDTQTHHCQAPQAPAAPVLAGQAPRGARDTGVPLQGPPYVLAAMGLPTSQMEAQRGRGAGPRPHSTGSGARAPSGEGTGVGGAEQRGLQGQTGGPWWSKRQPLSRPSQDGCPPSSPSGLEQAE